MNMVAECLTNVRVDHVVDIIRRQPTSCKAIHNIWIRRDRPSILNVLLDGQRILAEIPSEAQIEQHACQLACSAICVLNEESQGWNCSACFK